MEKRINEIISEEFQMKLEGKKLTKEDEFKLIYFLLFKCEKSPITAIDNISDVNVVACNESDDLTDALKNLMIQLIFKVYELRLDNVNIAKLIKREEI